MTGRTATPTEDIVLRLRSRPNDSPMHAEYMMDDAADEIDRLREALEKILDEGDNGDSMAAIARIALRSSQP